MKTARTDSAIKTRFLEAATRLMLAKGYSATSVDEICSAAKATKGGFFHYFASKESLGRSVLERYASSMFEVVSKAPFTKKSDPLQRVYGYVDFLIERSKSPDLRNGCIVGNFAQMLSETHPAIGSLCNEFFGWWSDAFKADLDKTKAAYAPRSRINTKDLADHLLSVFEGSLMLAKSKRDVNIVEKNLLHYKRYLKSLFEQ
jgi:TetR/AcrR family transcriptional repressor of nem operon